MNPAKTSSNSADSLAQPLFQAVSQVESLYGLAGKDDTELVALALARPQEGRYFLALYCRYRGLVESLLCLKPDKRSAEVIRLEATLWSQVYDNLRQFDLRQDRFVSWLVTQVAKTLANISDELPLSLSSGKVPVPLVPFLRRALDELPQPQRLLLILHEIMDFPISEMLEMLDKEGYTLTEEELATQLQRANYQVLGALPQDIYTMYFEKKSDLPSNA
ncbi:MAG: hypothetical protein WCA07_04530 [Gloeobacterales cyanobacterium]